jgi:hypothetical protein
MVSNASVEIARGNKLLVQANPRNVVKYCLILSFALTAGCVTESGHIHPVTLPNGNPGYVITCNSQRYERCLNRAAKTCNGPYTLQPDARTTVRLGDQMEGVGNSEHMMVSCGSQKSVRTD